MSTFYGYTIKCGHTEWTKQKVGITPPEITPPRENLLRRVYLIAFSYFFIYCYSFEFLMLFYIVCVNGRAVNVFTTDFSVFPQFLVYVTSKMGELKALHIIMHKRDTESVKVAPESVLSNRGGISNVHT